MIKVSFKTQNGHYLIANDATTAFKIAATPDGVGPWEVFTIISLSRDDDTIHNGDKIHLQTHTGRYVMARNGGGGTVTGEATLPQEWETFTIENFAGGGEIAQGDLVTFRTNNGTNFLMARDGGGGVVTADSRNRQEWETFSLEYWNPALVRLKAHNSQYLVAENGGGREINANRDSPNEWETFTLVNRSRKSGLRDGDSVCLQTWDRRFVSAQSGGGASLRASQNRASSFETFTILKTGGGEIRLFDQVSFRTQNRHYLMALGGGGAAVDASSNQAREWESFQIEAADLRPITFPSALTTPVRAGHPLPSPLPRKTGRAKLICFVIGFQNLPVDDSINSEVLRSFFFDRVGSIREWFEKTSYGAFSISSGGVFAPLTVPWDYVGIPDQDYYSGLLRLAEDQGLRFRDLDTDRNGIITGEELLFVVMDCSNVITGHREALNFSYGGIRYAGQRLTVGIYAKDGPVQGRAQLENVKGTVSHELSHILFDLPDRYFQPFPPRGDVIATSQNRGDWEKFKMIDLEGSIIESGHRVRLQMQDDRRCLVFDATDRKHLNRGGAMTDPSGEFVIEKHGAGSINHLDRVHLKAASTRQYLMANRGGGDVVQVIAERPGSWETFVIERDAGAGPVQSNELVTLKTLDDSHGTSFYLMAEPDGRKNDAETLRKGWWETWADSARGNGVGGAFDLMDDDGHRGMHAAFDRIRMGWIVPRVLTPDNKAWYVLNPSVDHPEAFILWDPAWPEDWYVVENRQRRVGLDDIPSSGLIISWVNEHTSYWRRWYHDGNGKSPAVISAAAPTAPPNIFIQLLLLRDEFFKRHDPNTAFRTGTYVLPRGDGSRSRFVLSFRELPPAQVEFCIM